VLEKITPVILSFNEEDNIGRTLDRLEWAKDIVVVDSYSTDNTLAILGDRPRVRVFQRAFDTHASQWNFAIAETGIQTEWALALDSDYGVTQDVVAELAALQPPPDVGGYTSDFLYCIWGKPIRSALYTRVTVLFRRERSTYEQDGHTQRVRVAGNVLRLRSKILHDDRKPLSRWLAAQDRYMKLEAEYLLQKNWSALSWTDKVRRSSALAPLLAFIFSYAIKGGWRDGQPGLYYALQRMLAEALLTLRLIEKRKS
jgi:glycosyltransferase involved in cell wall biosynthesis